MANSTSGTRTKQAGGYDAHEKTQFEIIGETYGR
jgi:hypothetical protein